TPAARGPSALSRCAHRSACGGGDDYVAEVDLGKRIAVRSGRSNGHSPHDGVSRYILWIFFAFFAATADFGLAVRSSQKASTASTTAPAIVAWRSGVASCSSSVRLMIDPASSSTAGMRVFLSTMSLS